MLIEVNFDRAVLRFEIPDKMIENYRNELLQLQIGNDFGSIGAFRERAIMAINSVYSTPELLEDQGAIEGFIKAQAVKQALVSLNMLYNS